MYITDLERIDVPPFVLSDLCTDVNIVTANDTYFEATAKSRIDTNLPTGHIQADRYVWFT